MNNPRQPHRGPDEAGAGGQRRRASVRDRREPADAKDWDDQPVGGGGGARDWAEYPEEDAPRSARREEDRRPPHHLRMMRRRCRPGAALATTVAGAALADETRETALHVGGPAGRGAPACIYWSPDVRDAQREKARQAAEDGVAYVEEVKTVAQRLKMGQRPVEDAVAVWGGGVGARAGPHVESRRI